MKKALLFLLCAAFTVFFSGCFFVNLADHNAVAGKGDLESYTFKVGDYNRIRVDGFYNIRYYSSPSDTVKLEIQPNLLEYFKIEVKEGELVVSSTRNIRIGGKKTPVLTVSTPELKSLVVDGAGAFTAIDKIKTDSFTIKIDGAGQCEAELDVKNILVDISGAGELTLSGRADTADINMSGAGELNAFSLQAREAKINLSGTGEIEISCSENLSVNASGLGSIEYRGSPVLDMNSEGLVSIKKVN